MLRSALALAVIAAATVYVPPAEAGGDLVLIVNEKNAQSPTLGEAKRVYVGDVMYWSGNVPVHRVIRPADTNAGVAFYRAIEVTPSRFRRLWQEKQFSGQGVVPETIPNTSAVLSKVASDPGAVAVAMSDEIPAQQSGVRVILLR